MCCFASGLNYLPTHHFFYNAEKRGNMFTFLWVLTYLIYVLCKTVLFWICSDTRQQIFHAAPSPLVIKIHALPYPSLQRKYKISLFIQSPLSEFLENPLKMDHIGSKSLWKRNCHSLWVKNTYVRLPNFPCHQTWKKTIFFTPARFEQKLFYPRKCITCDKS